jgi:hypothetical protein
MMRVIIENILLFLLPSLMYVGYVLLMRRRGATAAGEALNDAPLVWLFLLGALLVAGTLAFFGSTSGGKPGQVYVPPHVKNGHIEPGHME